MQNKSINERLSMAIIVGDKDTLLATIEDAFGSPSVAHIAKISVTMDTLSSNFRSSHFYAT